MPCLELKIAEKSPTKPATRLRALLDKPNAAVLRRNHIAEAPGHDVPALHQQLRVTAVLAVDITNPPQPTEQPAKPVEAAVEGESAAGIDTVQAAAAEAAEIEPNELEQVNEFGDSFAAGLEIWIAVDDRAVRILVDAEEIPGALLMFDAYSRLAKYQPAYLRLDQRHVGISYSFREGLVIGIEGNARAFDEDSAAFFDSVSAIAEIDDLRENRLVVRLPHAAIAWFQALLHAASSWLSENSYQSILGA